MAIHDSKPSWLRRRLPATGSQAKVVNLLDEHCLHTVCQEAECPNQMECYGKGTATFLLLGPSCTRRCTFCAVDKGKVLPPDPDEPLHVAEAVSKMGFDFCVLTMCSRDDLPDGGGEHVAKTIETLRQQCPGVGVEVLISDLGGSLPALNKVLEARPEVLNHNIETVPRLYPEVRPQADYQRSLELLSRADKSLPRPVTKSGLMLGLGETKEEVLKTLDDLRSSGCDLLTLGQYLAPSKSHHPVVRYVHPDEFEELKRMALERGFKAVASGPFVRSSYKASDLYREACS